jgi:hypothetical protein
LSIFKHGSKEFSLLSLYTLLSEKNGSSLKKQIYEHLRESFGHRIPNIEKYVMEKYHHDKEKVLILQYRILHNIHYYVRASYQSELEKREVAGLEKDINRLAQDKNALFSAKEDRELNETKCSIM